MSVGLKQDIRNNLNTCILKCMWICRWRNCIYTVRYFRSHLRTHIYIHTSMFVCMCACALARMYTFIFQCSFEELHAHKLYWFLCTHTHKRIFINVCVYVCVWLCSYLYARVCVCTRMRVSVRERESFIKFQDCFFEIKILILPPTPAKKERIILCFFFYS